ncbi:MAG: hypothetical protein K2W95_35515 [Candidatus Obscuribacterales bacterium]|nr:hypothetical protein [Candidatus Obscuribacterales bacterium]
MRECFQFQQLTVLDHGLSVHEWFKDLYAHLTQGTPLQRIWRLPDWINDPLIPQKLLDFELLQTYQVYHDCGKPLCRTVDADERQHFPNHAEASRKRWLECSDGSPVALQIADLIAMDMDAHLLKADGIAEFAARREAISLLVTALCEIHSNADMFGGIESVNFKIKWKALEKTGKRILAQIRSQAH